jgi:hypothetical protein
VRAELAAVQGLEGKARKKFLDFCLTELEYFGRIIKSSSLAKE